MARPSRSKVKRVIAKADTGDTAAMLEYCSWFSDLDKMEADRETKRRILRYLRAGAKAGDGPMLCNLGAEYYSGGLVKQDFSKALHYYELSAAKGCPQALSNLGYCYYYGRSVPVDYHKAFEYFLKAYILSPFGLPEVYYKLGDCFRHGRGVTADVLVARKLYELAYTYTNCPTIKSFKEVESGWDVRLLGADAAARLGDCYRLGIGGAIDLKKAERFYKIAIAGFKRKFQFGDCFATSLQKAAEENLRKIREPADVRPRRRKKCDAALVTDVAGMMYAANWEKIFAALEVGDSVLLLRDPGNGYDANAIAVANADGERFGWIPRAVNSTPAMLMDNGESLSAKIINKGIRNKQAFVTLSITLE